jgi:hypothetical protein
LPHIVRSMMISASTQDQLELAKSRFHLDGAQ